MTTDQLEYTHEELLASHRFEEPLVAGGRRCHGGFDADGNYVSPRTAHRVPAIKAWQANHRAVFGSDLLDIPLETWPEHYPNVAQAKLLIRSGVPQPVVSTLTRIGTVEGFGAMIRNSPLPDLQRCFDEDIRNTALAHLPSLYEAHARDEAGFEDEAGHRDMWFAARDVAFEDPVDEADVEGIMARMGFRGRGGGSGGAGGGGQQPAPPRLLPDDVPVELEGIIASMARILLIEIQAFHTFAWAEQLLADTDLVAGEGAAARLVSYIRADETPHVEYLKTVLTEMRDRTFVGGSGRRYPGTDMVGRVWEASLADSTGPRREQNLRATLSEVQHHLDGHPKKGDLLEEFHALGNIAPPTGAAGADPGEPATY